MKPLLRTFAPFLMIATPLAVLAQPAATSPSARAAWGFDRSDLVPHLDVRFGVLANGMRYALMRGAAPAGALSVRLRIGAGAAAEGAREAGSMHLLEHLIFQGSGNLPPGALLLMLPREGLKRAADFDAFTTYDETVYRLELAKADARARATALTVLREIASGLDFAKGTVARAKTSVVQEIAARDAVVDRIATAQDAFFAPGTAIARGPVAGTPASVRRASPAELKRLYARTYVPRRTTLVMVGDFDPAAAEAEIVARFADWRAQAADTSDPPASAIRGGRGVEGRLFVDPAAPTSVAVAAVEPLGDATDAGARRDGLWLEHMGAEMLNRRLARIGAREDAPFAKAAAAVYDHHSTARLALVEAAATDRDWRRALTGAAMALRSALASGFSQAELDAQIAVSRRALGGAASPRSNAALADALIDAAARGIVFTAPAGPEADAAYLARVRLADVDRAFRAAWASSSRLIFVTHDRPVPDAGAAIVAAWNDGQRTAAATEPAN